MRYFCSGTTLVDNSIKSMVMKVNVNNKEVECTAAYLSELISELGVQDKGIAVAVNNRMVPSTQWAKHELHENDMILIIKAVCGG